MMYNNFYNNNQNTAMYPQQTIQSAGFYFVQNEMEARRYPLAPGNSATFKDLSAPFIYVKTMGFSPMEEPKFERFRLVKEEAQQETPQEAVFASKADFNTLAEEVYAIKAKLAEMSGIGGEKSASKSKSD